MNNLHKTSSMRICLISFLILVISCKQINSEWIDRSKHEGLHNINYSEVFETYCTEKEPTGIKNTINNLEQAKYYFDKVFNEDLSFAVLFVDNPNWNKYAFSPPPGMPQAYQEGNIVLGLGNSMMAMRATQGLQQVPEVKLEELKKHFREDLDLDLFFRDALSLHELGHLYQFYKTGKGTQRQWLNEVFGNLCQVAAAKNLKSKDVYNRMDSYQLFLIEANQWGTLKYTTLKQFEEDYFDVQKQGRNYGWYQTKFYVKAKELYLKNGDEFLNEFRNFLIEINPEKVGELDDKDLKKRMINAFGKEAVAILEWNHSKEI